MALGWLRGFCICWMGVFVPPSGGAVGSRFLSVARAMARGCITGGYIPVGWVLLLDLWRVGSNSTNPHKRPHIFVGLGAGGLVASRLCH